MSARKYQTVRQGTLAISLGLALALTVTAGSQSRAANSLPTDTGNLQQIPWDSLPAQATYWSWQYPVGRGNTQAAAPLPVNPFGPSVPVFSLGNGQYLIDNQPADVPSATNVQAALQRRGNQPLAETAQAGAAPTAMSAMVVANNASQTEVSANVSYPSNALWLELVSVSPAGTAGGVVSLKIHGTTNDTKYEVLSTASLNNSGSIWSSETMPPVPGATGQDWTLANINIGNRTNQLFLRARSYVDADGNSLPDWWEEKYFGATGLNAYQDYEGDGYTLLYKYLNGMNPTNFASSPLAPQNVTVDLNQSNWTATVSWTPAGAGVTGYTIERYQGWNLSGTWNVGMATSFFDPNYPPYLALSTNFPNGYPWLNGDQLDPTIYAVYAQYGTRGSAVAYGAPTCFSLGCPVTTLPVQSNLTAFCAYPDPSYLPAGASKVRFVKVEFSPNYASTNITMLDVPVASLTNGIYVAPPNSGFSFLANHINSLAYSQLIWQDGSVGQIVSITPRYPVYYDARVQLAENLNFVLRAAGVAQMPSFGTSRGSAFFPTNYAFAGFGDGATGSDLQLPDPFPYELTPVYANYLYRNMVYDYQDFDQTQSWACYQPQDPNGGTFWYGPKYVAPDLASGNSFTNMLPSDVAQWIMPHNDFSMVGGFKTNCVLYDANMDSVSAIFYGVQSSVYNLFGLRLKSIMCVGYDRTNDTPASLELAPGQMVHSDIPPLDDYGYWSYLPPIPSQDYSYCQANFESPNLMTTGYIFGGVSSVNYSYNSTQGTLPGLGTFSPADSRPKLLFASCGQEYQAVAYAQQTLLNGDSSKPAYLGLYFQSALQVGANGNGTNQTAGYISPYGTFIATQPGPVAVVTMDDGNGERATNIVNVIKLQLDVNHDGVMDLSSTGPDNTSDTIFYGSRYFNFWLNNDYDRSAYDSDDSAWYEDSVSAANGNNVPDCDFNESGRREIPVARDLEDYARLWICGLDSNLVEQLPKGYSVTLSWASEGVPPPNNPTIDLFAAADPDGGTGYLTNRDMAARQIDPTLCPYLGRLGPGDSIQLNSITLANNWAGNHFIWCGVKSGSGRLRLAIADTNGAALAQSVVYVNIKDIKQMYERWTVGDDPSKTPLTSALPAQEDLPAGTLPFQYAQSTDTNTPYILFVHGWNMNRYDKDRFAERAFKRLYWQGYQGRFGSFRWPTESGFKGVSSLATNPDEKDNFDRSEYTAWRSARGLLNKITDLNATYSGHVYLLAHSMGNVVAGEALRLAGNKHVVNTYVATQAAVSAHTYDTNIANYSFSYPPYSLSASTPNIYGNWFLSNDLGGAMAIINFFNTNDYALQRSVWQCDQLLKPDTMVMESGEQFSYYYSGNPNDPPPWTGFYKLNDTFFKRVDFDIANVLTNRYEVMALAAQSYTTALGSTPNVRNILNDDLAQVWPSDPTGKNYSQHFWHSAEFRGDYWQQQNYWNELLSANGFKIKLP